LTNIDSVGAPAPSKPAKPPKVNITVKFVTPGPNVTTAPDATAGAQTQNQYTYSAAKPGVLRIELRAEVSPAGNALEGKKRVRFKVDKIPGSQMRWEGNAGGKPTRINGEFVETAVTFTKLPLKNAHFGKKKATLMLDGSKVEEREYMVFFPRDARNHPGKAVNIPNWFYYWKALAIAAGYPTLVYDGAAANPAEVKGMTKWSYTAHQNKRKLYIHDSIVGKYRSYGVGKLLSGIDRFLGTVFHEWKHTDQIARADTLVPHTRCWRYGYSWNKMPHNHWRSGRPDGKWGAPPIATAAVNKAPPFQIGAGADIAIDNPAHTHWPNVWALPALPGPHPIEQEAINHSDAHINEDQYADDDWADPGKNHLDRRWDT
jgi:hypothetical protein